MRELFLLDGDDADDAGWQERALCAQTDPEAFFPEKGGSTREAKKVCLTCDVRTECLESALMNDERFGIWGGLSERERRKLKKSAASSRRIERVPGPLARAPLDFQAISGAQDVPPTLNDRVRRRSSPRAADRARP